MNRSPPKTTIRSCRRGIAALECAIVLPMMLTIALGTIELGTALRASTIMQAAIREAGRMANMKWQDFVQDGDTPNDKIERDLRNFVTASGLPGRDLKVAITYAVGAQQGNRFDLTDEKNSLELVTITLSLPYSSISLFPVRYMKSKALMESMTLRSGMGGDI